MNHSQSTRRLGRSRALAACVALIGTSCATPPRSTPSELEPIRSGLAKNVVLFVGDGMGISTVTAARILEGQLRGESGEENLLAFESLPHTAFSRTYNTNQQVPDSAGTMTAMATGAKTRAGMLSVSAHVDRGDARASQDAQLETLFEQAEARGLATGVVTTSRVTHATPAACYAHSPERDWESDADLPEAVRAGDFPDIARQLLEQPIGGEKGDGIEVVLGGGRARFLPQSTPDPEDDGVTGTRLDGRDLTAEWLAKFPSSEYVFSADQLAAVDASQTDHLLGLFHPSHMQFDVDRPRDVAGEPSLAEMTEKALAIVGRNQKGFVLLVEGGRIDHGHHASNAYRALTDAIAFSDAVRAAMRATDPQETLLVVTADHSHTFTIGGYATRGNDILGLVVENDETGHARKEPAVDLTGKPYTTLQYANGPGYAGASDSQPEGAKRFPHFPNTSHGIREGRPDLREAQPGDGLFLQEATVPLGSETHAGEDVPIYAGGPGAQLFHGSREQTYVYHAIVKALGWSDPTTRDDSD